MRKIFQWVLTATLVCGASVLTACKEAHAQEDNPVQQVTSEELIRAGRADHHRCQRVVPTVVQKRE